MNSGQHVLLSVLATTLLSGIVEAQTPQNPPPWWGVSDDRTLSLYFDLDTLPLVPQVIGGPPTWYNPAVTGAVITGPLQVIANLAGHSGVLGLAPGAAPARLQLTIDNDPHLNWVKIFYFQFDVFEGTAGSIIESLEQDLQQFERSSLTFETDSIGGGWETVTINAELWPQPDDEEIDWSFLSDAVSDTGIDNLFISSKCIKVEDADEGGDALGDVDQAAFVATGLNLFAATGADCQSVAVTQDPVSLQRTYWISALAQGAGNHRIFRLDQTGAQIGTAPLPFTAATAPNGISDLAVLVRRPGPLARYQAVRVYALVYQQNGSITLSALDLATGVPTPGFDIQVQGLPALPPQDYGLAYNPSGDTGSGSFVITDPAGLAYEIAAATGVFVRSFPIPTGTTGAGYDHVFGNYYFWTNQPTPTPAGMLRTTGFLFSGYDLRATGMRFWGSLQIPNAGTLGGVASGLEVYRRQDGSFRIACVAVSSQGNRLYELNGPFKFGRSLHGRTRMTGQPIAGSPNLDLILDGIRPSPPPTPKFAALYAGFSNTINAGIALPFDLAGFGLDESQVLVSLDMHSQLLAQSTTGEFRFSMPTLPPGFSGAQMFFQWLVFDTTVQNGLAMSSAGKTLIY